MYSVMDWGLELIFEIKFIKILSWENDNDQVNSNSYAILLYDGLPDLYQSL